MNTTPDRARILRQAKLIAGLVAAVLLLAFVLQNTEPTTISFLFWGFTLPRIALIAICFAAGLLAGMLLYGLSRRR